MVQANAERVLRDLYMLREIGRYETGVHRPTLCEEDMTTRRWLRDELTAIGHDAHIDGIANVIGLSRAPGRKLLCGSHLETQSRAGWLDGVLGVVYALEAARVLVESGRSDIGVDVIAFADEEGHFGDMLGSRSLIGKVSEEIIDTARDRTSGLSMRRALENAGLAHVSRATLQRERYIGMFEAHIEQGPSLEADGLKIGIVTSIVGSRQFHIKATGVQNHAGTTRMNIRKDAGAALMRIYHGIETQFPTVARPSTVWTVGKFALDPGAPAIVPGAAEMLFQFRDTDLELLERMDTLLKEIVANENVNGPCEVTLTPQGSSVPAAMAQPMQATIEAAAESLVPGKHVRMPSGAGHDARTISELLPTAMMFIPSIGGVSHHYSEDTADADIRIGAQVFVEAVFRMLEDTGPNV
ncbi:MAG: hydantoinase/carbamoylase family amidase [Gammaproteobacteria bacterium]|nr:hydantoinase/carbamoylase family amidase [Gammaproteobacteria bacterium]